jgi:hypothetical protein
MTWYKVHFSRDDLTTGRHIRLQTMFATLFHLMHEPTGAVMFGNRNAQDDYTYYFASPSTVFTDVMLSDVDASECTPPVPQSVVGLAGDVGARGPLQR